MLTSYLKEIEMTGLKILNAFYDKNQINNILIKINYLLIDFLVFLTIISEDMINYKFSYSSKSWWSNIE